MTEKEKFKEWLIDNMGLKEPNATIISNHVNHYYLEPAALTESQRKEWADMCIRKQARIEELEVQIESMKQGRRGIYDK